MNRIILIGNGFDLAHCVKTSYKDFIDDYWHDVLCKLNNSFREYRSRKYDYSDDKINIYISTYIKSVIFNFFEDILNFIDKEQYEFHSYPSDPNEQLEKSFIFHNKFLRVITEQKSITNWIDIEELYYQELKNIISNKSDSYTNIKELNDDFYVIKNMLEEYLSAVHEDFKKMNIDIFSDEKFSRIYRTIYSKFKIDDFTDNEIYNFVEEQYQKYIEGIEAIRENQINSNELGLQEFERKLIDRLTNSINVKSEIKEIVSNQQLFDEYFEIFPKNILFLNFNYTSTENLYLENNLNTKQEIQKECIHIHGELNNENNPIIFGYGDELDEDYRRIESINDNDYLENIKSIKYLQTDSYKKVLNFIHSDKYQIFIFGHSCGNSDRTLLNTLFEHENCCSIKPFYYTFKNKNNVEIDNYSELVKNISRNFNDKVKMRDKVVNKSFTDGIF